MSGSVSRGKFLSARIVGYFLTLLAVSEISSIAFGMAGFATYRIMGTDSGSLKTTSSEYLFALKACATGAAEIATGVLSFSALLFAYRGGLALISASCDCYSFGGDEEDGVARALAAQFVEEAKSLTPLPKQSVATYVALGLLAFVSVMLGPYLGAFTFPDDHSDPYQKASYVGMGPVGAGVLILAGVVAYIAGCALFGAVQCLRNGYDKCSQSNRGVRARLMPAPVDDAKSFGSTDTTGASAPTAVAPI